MIRFPITVCLPAGRPAAGVMGRLSAVLPRERHHAEEMANHPKKGWQIYLRKQEKMPKTY
jgi:hypothetical protein